MFLRLAIFYLFFLYEGIYIKIKVLELFIGNLILFIQNILRCDDIEHRLERIFFLFVCYLFIKVYEWKHNEYVMFFPR